MNKYEHAFGKNDIRGIYGEDITEELFYHTGRALVQWLERQSGKAPENMQITVTIDARTHSPSLRDALNQGITSTGAGVINLGLAPTPIGYYSEAAGLPDEVTNGKGVIAAAIITASHNPSEYNGMKMTYNGTTLNEAQIKEIKLIVDSLLLIDQPPTINHQPSTKEYDILPDYLKAMKAQFGDAGKGVKVVVDSANATGGVIGPDVYRAIGCEVVELFSEPDGRFPNHHPNPSDLSTLADLQKAVVEHKADLGIAFDGDTDRIGVVDAAGCPIPGDMLLLIYALEMLESPRPDGHPRGLTSAPLTRGAAKSFVCEVKCSQIVFDEINTAGGNAVMAKTGHGYIKSKMKETNAIFGGEMSGHTFFKDRYYGFDDAVYAGCRVIEIVAKHKNANPNFKIQDLLAKYEGKSFSSELRHPCPNERKKEVFEKFKAQVEANPMIFGSPIKEIITIDGMRIVFDGGGKCTGEPDKCGKESSGFALIRQSNTEPVFTLRFEAKTPEMCERLHNTMVNMLDEILNS
jgi:phosphomannomutase/phosphoglucomutase